MSAFMASSCHNLRLAAILHVVGATVECGGHQIELYSQKMIAECIKANSTCYLVGERYESLAS